MPKETFFNLDSEKQQRIVDAGVQEFAKHTYNEVKLSNIIKSSNIPRGSFYQYFEDKRDLYKYIFDRIAQEKMKYLGVLLSNPNEVPFFDLFRELYKGGLNFAIDNPNYVRITKNLLLVRGEIFTELVGDGLNIARNYYVNWIESDKKLGRIREDVDSRLLADIVIESTTNIAFDELNEGDTINADNMLKRLESLIKILKKGTE